MSSKENKEIILARLDKAQNNTLLHDSWWSNEALSSLYSNGSEWMVSVWRATQRLYPCSTIQSTDPPNTQQFIHSLQSYKNATIDWSLRVQIYPMQREHKNSLVLAFVRIHMKRHVQSILTSLLS